MSVRSRASGRAGRPPMRSPGRPPVGRREHRQRFWAAIARGVQSEDAGLEAGVSPAVGVRWFREGGGMPSVSLLPTSGRYLSFAEREEIALLRAGGAGVREVARRLARGARLAPTQRRPHRSLGASSAADGRSNGSNSPRAEDTGETAVGCASDAHRRPRLGSGISVSSR